jgi:hypothetical protein
MVTAERFSQIAGSYWSSLLPRLSNFVSIANKRAQQFGEPLELTSSPLRRPLVTETAFVAWKNGTLADAEDIARARLAVVWDQVPIVDSLSPFEWHDVEVIRNRLEGLREIGGIKDLSIEPILAGCGFLASGAPDFVATIEVQGRAALVLGEIKMVERHFRSVDFRQVICYLALYYAQHAKILEYLWLVNPIRGVLIVIDVDSFFALVRGQPSSEAVPELVYEWSSPGVSP